MGSNNSTLVISIAIGILLLLILLLLLSYNSKAKADKIERFEDNEDNEDDTFYGGSSKLKSYDEFTNEIKTKSGINDKDNYRKRRIDASSLNTQDTNEEKFSNMEGSSIDNSYSLLSENPSNANNVYKDPTACFKRDRLTATDLLPTEASSKWAQINPSSSGELSDQNFLTAGYHVGINTVGQTMRNANLQLRSEVPNPQVAVSPWLISTIEPDVRNVSFEIGSAPQTPPS
jgi:hypothetical protein